MKRAINNERSRHHHQIIISSVSQSVKPGLDSRRYCRHRLHLVTIWCGASSSTTKRESWLNGQTKFYQKENLGFAVKTIFNYIINFLCLSFDSSSPSISSNRPIIFLYHPSFLPFLSRTLVVRVVEKYSYPFKLSSTSTT